ncbi:MAG: hypothetical protein GF328_07160, partial [Candidatus Latescibacteria bacterium]|nr:hypothetical protein [Candidatus Latescibacterota bacterium]
MHPIVVRRLIPALLLLVAASESRAQDRLFLTEYQYENPKLKEMALDGTDPAELFDPPANEWLLVGLDFDAASGLLYWAHGSTPGTIRRAEPDGSGLELLVTGLKQPRGLALDPTGGKIYWAAAPPSGNALGLIQRANLDGSEVETFFELDPYDPVWSYVGPPTVDPTNGYVYFCAQNRIIRKRTDGTGAIEVVVRGVTTVRGIDLDIANRRIYFLDANTNSDYFGRCDLDDTGFTVLYDLSPGVNVSSGLWDLVVDPDGGTAFWTDEIAHQVHRCNVDGTGFAEIYDSPPDLYPVGLSFDVAPTIPIADCNGNGTRDRDDIDGGISEDC